MELVIITKVANLQGSRMLRATKQKPNVVAKRWAEVLPQNFKIGCANTWSKPQRKNRSRVHLGTIWNEPIAINTWKLKVNETIDKICQMCGNGKEIIVHTFWHYCFIQWAWDCVQKLLIDMVQELVVATMQWKHCIFVAKNPRIFQKMKIFGSY